MSQVASIYPFTVNEFKPGIHPPNYIIEGTRDEDKPTILDVKDAHYYIYTDNDVAQKVPVVADELANAIVNDFISGCFGIGTDARPGIFVVNDIEKDLPVAKEKQRNWFVRLVELADNDWAATNRPGSINKIQRYAAKALGVDREWTGNIDAVPQFCPACTKPVTIGAAICMNCRCIIDKEKFATLQFADAQ